MPGCEPPAGALSGPVVFQMCNQDTFICINYTCHSLVPAGNVICAHRKQNGVQNCEGATVVDLKALKIPAVEGLYRSPSSITLAH